MHVIAAKAVAFKEALDPKFTDYQKQVLENSRTMARVLTKTRSADRSAPGRTAHTFPVDSPIEEHHREKTLRLHSVAHRLPSIRMQSRMIQKSRR